MSTPRALEQLPDEMTSKVPGRLWGVEDAQTADKVPGIGIVFDVVDEVPLRPTNDAGGVVEVVCGGSKGVDLKLVDVSLGEVDAKHVDDEGALNPALAVQDQDDFVVLRVSEGIFDEGVAASCVLGVVEEVARDEALDEIEEDPIANDAMMVSAVNVLWNIGSTGLRWIVDTEDLAPKCFSQEIDVALEPVATDRENDETILSWTHYSNDIPNANTVDEYPVLFIMPGKPADIDIGGDETSLTIQREHA